MYLENEGQEKPLHTSILTNMSVKSGGELISLETIRPGIKKYFVCICRPMNIS